MCGFYLQVNTEKSLGLSKERINLIESRLSNRGADSTNSLYLKDKTFNYFLNHSRLIISGDKDNGKQPIYDNNHILLFNGQIYNYKELSTKHKINNSGSDTIFLFEFLKKNNFNYCMKFLRGPFAIVFINLNKNKIFIARDMFGESPLFFKETKSNLTISSDYLLLSQNKVNLLEKNTINEVINQGFQFSNQYTSSVVEPGKIISFKFSIEKNKFLSSEFNSNLRKIIINRNIKKNIFYAPKKNIIYQFIDILLKSVEEETNDFDSYGLLLSTGIDSNLLYQCFKRLNKKCTNYSVSTSSENIFLDNADMIYVDKVQYIRYLIKATQISCNNFIDLATPLVISLMSRAKEKVLIAGDGADELFVGYKKYKLSYYLDLLRPIYKEMPYFINKTILKFLNINALNKDINIFKKYPWLILTKGKYTENWDEYITSQINNEISNNILDISNKVDFKLLMPEVFLRKSDLASLYCDKQLRLPYLNPLIVDHISKNKDNLTFINLIGRQKSVLYDAFEILSGKKFTRNKTGFGMSRKWLREAVSEYIDREIPSKEEIYFLEKLIQNRL